MATKFTLKVLCSLVPFLLWSHTTPIGFVLLQRPSLVQEHQTRKKEEQEQEEERREC